MKLTHLQTTNLEETEIIFIAPDYESNFAKDPFFLFMLV